MLVKPRQTKDLKIKINQELVDEIELLELMAKESGWILDINAGIEKYLTNELPKIRKQLSKPN